MSNFTPSLVINEGIATGWAKIEIFGDKDYGALKIADGRKVLGALKSIHGVGQDQVDNAERTGGGGFFHMKHKLRDGSLIHAMTNDGHDTIRIYTPGFGTTEEPKKSKREDDFDPGEYMWVGIRVKDGCTRPWYALDVWMIEPNGNTYRGIVGCGFAAMSAYTHKDVDGTATGSDDEGWTITRDSNSFQASSRDDLVNTFYTLWYDDGNFSYTIQQGDHQGNSYIDVGSGDFFLTNWSVNGLMFNYWDEVGDAQTPFAMRYGPYDPLMSEAENQGQFRTFDGLRTNVGGTPTPNRYGWDAVFWLDPHDSKVISQYPGVKNVDKRPLVQETRRMLKDGGFFVPADQQVQSGVYTLVVRAYDTPPHDESTRSGEAVASTLMPPEYRFRSADCDYQERMEPVNEWPPLEVEVEVRIGRKIIIQRDGVVEPDELQVGLPSARFNFDLTCEEYDERYAVVYPHGAGEIVDVCGAEGGPNMGGPSFAQTVKINVREQTAVLGELSELAPMFAGGPYYPYQTTQRRRAAFFIHTAFPVVGDSDWEAFAGTALFDAMEAVTTGVYGCSDMKEMTEGDCQALFAGTSKLNVYMYDATNGGGLTNLGPATTTSADYAPYDPPLDSTNFFWYYEKAVAYQNACWRTYGIAVTSVGGFYELSQNHASDPNFTSPDCCVPS